MVSYTSSEMATQNAHPSYLSPNNLHSLGYSFCVAVTISTNPGEECVHLGYTLHYNHGAIKWLFHHHEHYCSSCSSHGKKGKGPHRYGSGVRADDELANPLFPNSGYTMGLVLVTGLLVGSLSAYGLTPFTSLAENHPCSNETAEVFDLCNYNNSTF